MKKAESEPKLDIMYHVLSRMPKNTLTKLAEKYNAMPSKSGHSTRKEIAESLLTKISYYDLVGNPILNNSRINGAVQDWRTSERREYGRKLSFTQIKTEFYYQLRQIVEESPGAVRPAIATMVKFMESLKIDSIEKTIAAIKNDSIPRRERGLLCWFLPRLNPEDAEEILQSLTKVAAAEVRVGAIENLVEYNSEKTIFILTEAIADEDERVAIAAMKTLSKLDPSLAAVAAKSIVSETKSEKLLVAAVIALGNAPDKKAILALKSALLWESVEVKFWAMQSIEKILAKQVN
ncbi:MAG: HEAT repeat domain-containing protein [Prochloraceae cyanobacterium]